MQSECESVCAEGQGWAKDLSVVFFSIVITQIQIQTPKDNRHLEQIPALLAALCYSGFFISPSLGPDWCSVLFHSHRWEHTHTAPVACHSNRMGKWCLNSVCTVCVQLPELLPCLAQLLKPAALDSDDCQSQTGSSKGLVLACYVMWKTVSQRHATLLHLYTMTHTCQ